MSLLRQLLRPLVQRDQLIPTLNEVAERLGEEVDYLNEAGHVGYFAAHLKVAGVKTPAVRPHLSAPTVLCTTMMPGRPLDVWLKENPGQEGRDRIAQTLNDLFLTGLYELNVIHADPNPGNFIIGDDLTVGLVDFGCVKRLEPDFVEGCRQLASGRGPSQQRRPFPSNDRLGPFAAGFNQTGDGRRSNRI